MRRTSSGVSETRWRTPSSTTKSLPWPCILANLRRTPLFSPIGRRLAGRARLEALVRPEILLGHLEDALLDERVHAAHVRLEVAGGIVLPLRIELHHVAVAHLARDHRDHRGARELREARERGDGRRLHAEERHEDRVALA